MGEPIRQDRMEETLGWKDGYLGQTKETGQVVGGVKGGDEGGMTERVQTILVDPRIEAGIIVIANLFSRFDGVEQLDRIRSSSKKSVSRV